MKNTSSPKSKKWLYGIAIVIMFVAFIFAFSGGSEEKRYTWLNQCNTACQNRINSDGVDRVEFVHTRDCETLPSMYNATQGSYPAEWKLLINDKATNLGCEGFPK